MQSSKASPETKCCLPGLVSRHLDQGVARLIHPGAQLGQDAGSLTPSQPGCGIVGEGCRGSCIAAAKDAEQRCQNVLHASAAEGMNLQQGAHPVLHSRAQGFC